jgi:hypothetical protein
MPALPSILQTRENSYRYLDELLKRLGKAVANLAWEIDYQRRTNRHEETVPQWRYLSDCLVDAEKEYRYLRGVVEEIKRQEEGDGHPG